MMQYLARDFQNPSQVPSGSWAAIHLSPSLNRAQRILFQIHSHLGPLIGKIKMTDILKGRAHPCCLVQEPRPHHLTITAAKISLKQVTMGHGNYEVGMETFSKPYSLKE